MNKFLQLIAVTVSLGFFLAFIVVSWFVFIWHIHPITSIKEPVVFQVPPGISTLKLAQNLYKNQLINNMEYFLWLVKMKGEMTEIKTGDYRMTPGMSASQLLNELVKGKTVLKKVTLIEGWTFRQFMDSLNKNPYVTHTLQGKTPEEVMQAIGHEGERPEGKFYPDTYLFMRGTHDVKLLKISYQQMQEKFQQAWKTSAPDLPYKTPEEALIVASMVEKEALFHKERPQVAGVILKRLAIGMRLQIDATVIYGRDQNHLNPITRADLSTDTPYNTYTRAGLPVAPICMPSFASIQAALHPVITDAIYYVAKGDGTHIFSQDLQGHNKAVGEYRVAVNLRAIILSALDKQCISPRLMLKYFYNCC
jgi:UPF0755 protein